MADIFLSYAREDREKAERLAKALEGQGLEVFWDREVPAGSTWADFIGGELEKASCVVVVWSTAAIASEWVREEATDGRKRDILVPALFEEVEPPSGFKQIQTEDLSAWDGHQAAPLFRRLVERIERFLRGTPTAGPSPVVFGLHGIRTAAKWQKAFAEVAQKNGLVPRIHSWDFGFFSVPRFLLPWARGKKLRWFRDTYVAEINDRSVPLKEGELPSIVAHSFGTYLVAYAMQRFKHLKFDRVLLCGSILPTDFHWQALFDRGQVRRLRVEYGVRDPWVRLVGWFVPATGPSGERGFATDSPALEQERFEYAHSEYFGPGHMEHAWVPFFQGHANQGRQLTPRPGPRQPWLAYLSAAIVLSLVVQLTAITFSFYPALSIPAVVSPQETTASTDGLRARVATGAEGEALLNQDPPNSLVREVFGPPGTDQATFDLPYTMKLAWDQRKTTDRMRAHRLAIPYFKAALTEIKEAGLEGKANLWGGTFNKVKKRGGTEWSHHAWGIEIDIDPEGNQLYSGEDQWRMDARVVRIFEKHGFFWRGHRGFNAASFVLSTDTIREIGERLDSQAADSAQ